jgi:hypothetical protein
MGWCGGWGDRAILPPRPPTCHLRKLLGAQLACGCELPVGAKARLGTVTPRLPNARAPGCRPRSPDPRPRLEPADWALAGAVALKGRGAEVGWPLSGRRANVIDSRAPSRWPVTLPPRCRMGRLPSHPTAPPATVAATGLLTKPSGYTAGEAAAGQAHIVVVVRSCSAARSTSNVATTSRGGAVAFEWMVAGLKPRPPSRIRWPRPALQMRSLPQARGCLGSQLVVPSPDVLHEPVSSNDHRGAAVLPEPAHRSQSHLESAVVGLDAAIGGTARHNDRPPGTARPTPPGMPPLGR